MEKPKSWTSTEYLALHQSKNTRINYKVALKQFFSLIYQTDIPKKGDDEIINKLSIQYLSEDRDHDKDMVAYFQSMAKYAPTTRAFKFSVLKSWLEVNGIALNSGVIRTLNGKKAVEAITKEYVPDEDEVKSILSHLPIHARAVTLVLLSSGMRPGEPFTLKFKDIDMESYPTKVSLRGGNTKSGRKRWTYITPQAKQELESWLSFKDQFVESKKRYGGKQDSELIFPFSISSFGSLWVNAVKKAGIFKEDDEKDDQTGRRILRPHNLRKYFATNGTFGDRDLAEFLMGHTGALRRVYTRYEKIEDTVREAYIKAIPSLTIGEGFGDTEVVQKLEEKIEDYQEETEETNKDVKFLLCENRTRALKIEKLEENVEALQTRLNEKAEELRQVVEWMEGEINARAVLLSKGADETILASKEEALADLQEKKSAKNR